MEVAKMTKHIDYQRMDIAKGVAETLKNVDVPTFKGHDKEEAGCLKQEIADTREMSPLLDADGSHHHSVSGDTNNKHESKESFSSSFPPSSLPCSDESNVPVLHDEEVVGPTVPLQTSDEPSHQTILENTKNSLNALNDSCADISDGTSIRDAVIPSPKSSIDDDKVVVRTKGSDDLDNVTYVTESVKEVSIATDVKCAAKEALPEQNIQVREETSNNVPVVLKKKPKKLESILSNLKSKSLLSQSSPVREEVVNVPDDEEEDEPIPELPPGTIIVTPTDVDVKKIAVRRKKHRKVRKHDLPLNKVKLEGMINAATGIKDLCGVTDGIIDLATVEELQHTKESKTEGYTELDSQNEMNSAGNNNSNNLQPVHINHGGTSQSLIQSGSGVTTNQPVMIGIAQVIILITQLCPLRLIPLSLSTKTAVHCCICTAIHPFCIALCDVIPNKFLPVLHILSWQPTLLFISK